MCNMVFMNILNPINNLLKIKSSLVLIYLFALHEFVELSFIGVLHDNKDIIGCIKHFIKFDNIWVVSKFQNSDLSFHLSICVEDTFDIIFLFFIFFLFMIFTATSMFVRLCLATKLLVHLLLTRAKPPDPIVLPNI